MAALSAPPKREDKSLSGALIAIATIEAMNTAVKITFINYFYERVFLYIRFVIFYNFYKPCYNSVKKFFRRNYA